MKNKSLNDQAELEYKAKLKIKEDMDQYYLEQTTKNGLESLDKVRDYLPTNLQPLHVKRNIAFSHLEIGSIIEKIANNEEFVVVSGLNPSSSLHLGHKALFDLLLSLQRLGARVFIPLTNDESLVDGKVTSLAQSRYIARNSILPSIVAMGFSPTKTHVFIDSEYPQLYNFAMHLSQFVTFQQVRQVFGEDSLKTPGQIFYRGVVQMAQILLPQLPEFGGPKPTLIPVGIDQHPYILLARDVAKKLKMVPPSELVIKFQSGLKDPQGKMSSSKPDSAIFLSDTPEDIRRKINKAYTGSVSILETYQKLGGIPEICSVFSLLYYHCPDDKLVADIKQKYQLGQITMPELKNMVISFISNLIQDHQQKVGIIHGDTSQFILSTPLESLLTI